MNIWTAWQIGVPSVRLAKQSLGVVSERTNQSYKPVCHQRILTQIFSVTLGKCDSLDSGK